MKNEWELYNVTKSSSEDDTRTSLGKKTSLPNQHMFGKKVLQEIIQKYFGRVMKCHQSNHGLWKPLAGRLKTQTQITP